MEKDSQNKKLPHGGGEGEQPLATSQSTCFLGFWVERWERQISSDVRAQLHAAGQNKRCGWPVKALLVRQMGKDERRARCGGI